MRGPHIDPVRPLCVLCAGHILVNALYGSGVTWEAHTLAAYRQINILQVEILRRLRMDPTNVALRDALLISINGVSAGVMRILQGPQSACIVLYNACSSWTMAAECISQDRN